MSSSFARMSYFAFQLFFNLNMTIVWCFTRLTDILMSIYPSVTFSTGRGMIDLQK